MSYVVKAASRHLLLSEVLLGTLLCGLGAAKSGDFNSSPYDLNALYAVTWLFPAVVGSIQAAMSGVEWLCGRSWSFRQLQNNVMTRGILAFLSVPIWLFELKEFLLWPSGISGLMVLLVAPLCCVLNCYSVFANSKVWYALHPRISTSRMHFD